MSEHVSDKSLRQWRRDAFKVSFVPSEFMMPIVPVIFTFLAFVGSLWLLIIPVACVVGYIIRFMYLYNMVCKMNREQCEQYIKKQKEFYHELANERSPM